MKKLVYNMLLILFIFFPLKVLAVGYVSISPGSLTIEQGSSKTFKISAYNAIGDVYIKSNNTSIATVNANEWGTGMVEEKQTKTKTITVTGKSIGSTTITLTIDAATFDNEDLSGQTKTIAVNVVAKKAPVTPSPQPSNPTPAPSPRPSVPVQSQLPNQPQTNLSTNNKLSSLTVEGHELVKVDDKNYTLTVMNSVDKVKINAIAEDTKAIVTGTGEKVINIGENKFQVVVTSESGSANIINILITRKDGYYLEDLEELLKNKNIQKIDVTINSDTKITKEQIEKIKDSKKIVNLNYYDKSKKLIYSWSIDGEKIEDTSELVTTITFPSKNENIYKAANYADGLYLKFAHTKELPKGTKLKVFVGNKFSNNNSVNVYFYDNNTLGLTKKDLKVKNGYIEFDIEKTLDSFITMSIIKKDIKESKEVKDTSSNNLLPIIEAIIIVGLIIFIFYKFKPLKKQSKIESIVNDDSLNQQVFNNSVNMVTEEILDTNQTIEENGFMNNQSNNNFGINQGQQNINNQNETINNDNSTNNNNSY